MDLKKSEYDPGAWTLRDIFDTRISTLAQIPSESCSLHAMHSTISSKEKLRLSDPWTSWPSEKQPAWNFHWTFSCRPDDVQLRPVTSMASGFLSQDANWFRGFSWIFVNPSTCWIDVGAHRIWQAVIVFWTALMFTNARFSRKLGFTDMMESNSQAATLHQWPASNPFSDLICVLELCTKIQKGKCLHVSRPSWSFVGRCGLWCQCWTANSWAPWALPIGSLMKTQKVAWQPRINKPICCYERLCRWWTGVGQHHGYQCSETWHRDSEDNPFLQQCRVLWWTAVRCPNWHFWSILGGQPLKASWHRLVFLLLLRC